MTSQAAESTVLISRAPSADVVHGYAPPARPPGSVVLAYCGALMMVRGEYSPAPPVDTCTDCIAIWDLERRGLQ
ncbi:MAG TPA: hypothetical protein VGP70_03045 [Actinomadura sp.]|nr:hypothetical protein [Actinomadura sp.]